MMPVSWNQMPKDRRRLTMSHRNAPRGRQPAAAQNITIPSPPRISPPPMSDHAPQCSQASRMVVAVCAMPSSNSMRASAGKRSCRSSIMMGMTRSEWKNSPSPITLTMAAPEGPSS